MSGPFYPEIDRYLLEIIPGQAFRYCGASLGKGTRSKREYQLWDMLSILRRQMFVNNPCGIMVREYPVGKPFFRHLRSRLREIQENEHPR